MSEWIRITSEMPEEKRVVLVCIDYNHKDIRPSILTAHWTGSTFKIGPNSVNINQEGEIKVTHWMPLPEPPK